MRGSDRQPGRLACLLVGLWPALHPLPPRCASPARPPSALCLQSKPGLKGRVAAYNGDMSVPERRRVHQAFMNDDLMVGWLGVGMTDPEGCGWQAHAS